VEEEKYYLVLTGELSEGQNREAAESALGRLLRMPPEKAGSLLHGKPSRIQKSLAGDKARHLMEKVLACGVGCRLEPAVSEETPAPAAERQAPGMRGRPLSRRLTSRERLQTPGTRSRHRLSIRITETSIPAPAPDEKFRILNFEF
jgi:hypothetical protein